MARKVRIELVLDAKGVVKGVRQLDDAIDDVQQKTSKTTKAFSGFKAALGGAFLAGVARQVAVFAKRMFELGSAVEETGSKFRTVFGAMSDEVDDFGKDFANMAGLTKREFRDVASVTGSILQGLGADLATSARETERILRLSADLASFNNVSIQEAFGAIRSGLIGESEPLKRFGIVLTEAETKLRALNDTGKESEKQLTNLEKAQARLNIIFANAGVAVGDLERTQTSAANEARKFNAIIREQEELLAEALLPALNEVRGAFSEAIVENKTFAQAGIALIGIWASEVVKGAEEIGQALVRWSRALGLINTETSEALRQQRLMNMLLSSHSEAATEAAETTDTLAKSLGGAEGTKGLTGITESLNEEIRKLSFQVRDLTQADQNETRALLAKVSQLREELRLRRQLLGLAGAPVGGLEEAPVRGPQIIGGIEPTGQIRQITDATQKRTDAERDLTVALVEQKTAEEAAHQAAIDRAVAIGVAQGNVLDAVLASVRQIIQARLAEAIAGATAAGSILGPLAAAASGALMAVLFNQLMPSGHKSSGGSSSAGARGDTTSSQGSALGGIRVQNRGFTTGAEGAAAGARAQQLTIRVVEPDLFRLNTELASADGVRAQVGAT